VKIKISGFEELQNKLTDLSSRVKELDGGHNVPIPELLSPVFLAGCSKFGSAQELFDASGFKINSQEDFKNIPDAEWDAFIKNNTSFKDWKDMLQAASAMWTKKKLTL
jgi:hypothetical protein